LYITKYVYIFLHKDLTVSKNAEREFLKFVLLLRTVSYMENTKSNWRIKRHGSVSRQVHA